MASMAFSTKIPLIEEYFPRFTRQQLCRGILWADPKIRPPMLEEMMPDIERVIASVALKYCDMTTPHLHFDEIMSEGKLKLAELITRGELERIPCRVEFFKFFATAVNNQARSRVQKYRFTEKRTGQKPPPRDQRFKRTSQTAEEHETEGVVPEHHKNVELSLDDPELGLQVPQTYCDSASEQREVEEEFEALLTVDEVTVFRQLHKPNALACKYAEYDAMRRRVGERLHIKIKPEHLARGIGRDLKQFEKDVLSIRRKITAHRMMTTQEQDAQARHNALVASLSQLFNLQIPQGLDDMVLRRLFTMAARDQFDEKVKGKLEVEEMLIEVGAKPPRMLGDKMACYGVLYQKNCRKCNSCDLRHSCAVEAANMGLDKMAISPRLLGATQQRIPAFLPRQGGPETHISSLDEAEVLAHLEETFEKLNRDSTVVYFHRVGPSSKRRLLFIVEQTSPLCIRFCNPSETLKKKLVGKQKVWRARDSAPLTEIIALIEQHAKETFV
jgi:hypothetical protein